MRKLVLLAVGGLTGILLQKVIERILFSTVPSVSANQQLLAADTNVHITQTNTNTTDISNLKAGTAFTGGATFSGVIQANGGIDTNTLSSQGGTQQFDFSTGHIKANVNIEAFGTTNLDSGNITTDGSGNITVKKTNFTNGSITRVQMIGQTSIAQGGTSVSHSLGVIPDIVIPILDEGSQHADTIGINYGTMSSSSFTAYTTNASGSLAHFLVLKA